MFGANNPRQGKGKPIRAATLTTLARSADALGKTRLGGAQWVVDGIPLGDPRSQATPGRLGVTAASIPARAGTTLGHGTVHIRTLRADWTTDEGYDLDCGNYTGGAIPGGKWVEIGWIDGVPVILGAEC